MPTVLGKKFFPNWLGVPPQMSKEDFEIWKRWRPFALRNAIAVYYDVGLGEGKPVDLTVSQNLRKMWLKVNQKRADVIIEYDNKILIVELRYNAQLDTIGRLVGYGVLWDKAPAIKKPTEFIIVTNLLDRDVKEAAEVIGIQYKVI